jgi:hypothetical protein
MPSSSNRFRMRRFERRHVGAIPAGGTFIGSQLDVSERHGPNVEVAGETPVGPTIRLLPGVTLARLALTQQDTVGFGGEQPLSAVKA